MTGSVDMGLSPAGVSTAGAVAAGSCGQPASRRRARGSAARSIDMGVSLEVRMVARRSGRDVRPQDRVQVEAFVPRGVAAREEFQARLRVFGERRVLEL